MPASVPSRRPSRRPLRHRRPFRLLRLARARARRTWQRLVIVPLIHASTWTYLAAGALVGFEALEILFGAFVLAPEIIPLLLVGLAAQWWLRERVRRIVRLWRLHRRRVRARRSGPRSSGAEASLDR